jgi:hypothetical protein
MSQAAGDRATSAAWRSVVSTRWDLPGAAAHGFDDARNRMCACAPESMLFMRSAPGPKASPVMRTTQTAGFETRSVPASEDSSAPWALGP